MSLVSIIIPIFNSELFIENTINSILRQTYLNFELLLIDDHSIDNSFEIVKKLAKTDSRIRVYRLEKNSGAAIARNKGLEIANGRFIAFCDSDDLWFENKLEIQINFMLNESIPISFTSYHVVNEYDKLIKYTINSVKKINYYDYLKNTIIGMSTSVIDKSIVQDIEFKNMRTRQDTLLWLTLLKKGYNAYGVNQVLVVYTERSNSISANKFKAAYNVWKIYYKIEKLGSIMSLYFFTFYIINAIKKRF